MISALFPEALVRLSAQHRVVLVSGTNGKTTTTLLLARALSSGFPVISNSDGANLTSGLLATLAAHARSGPSTAVLEVDEVALVPVLRQVRVELLLLLNLSRDQLDRTSEVTDHIRAWGAALAGAPETQIVANADDALVVLAVLTARPHGEGVVWVGAGKPFRQDTTTCPRCNARWDNTVLAWSCAACGFSRPELSWDLDGDELLYAGERFAVGLRLPGRANTSNAAMATAAACALGIPLADALACMRDVQNVEGRYATATISGHPLRLLLAKNPAGWVEALEQSHHVQGPVIIAINARDADGLDPSWLWDVPFEQLQGRTVIAIGERVTDLAVRLTYANLSHQVAPNLRAAIELLPAGPADIIANYTAFVTARELLSAGAR